MNIIPLISRISLFSAIFSACTAVAETPDGTGGTYESLEKALGDGLKENVQLLQHHDAVTEVRAVKRAYDSQFDLASMPSYRPETVVTGTFRVAGPYLALGNVAGYWKEGFTKFHPGLRFVATEDGQLGTFASSEGQLIPNQVDVVMGNNLGARLGDLSVYELDRGSPPLEIDWCTGSYNVPGWTPAFAIFVNRENPLTKLTMSQLDGIFGGARTGGWQGTVWHKETARKPEGNIRTWGQLGLTGDWAGKPINIYGRPIKYGIQLILERKFFHGGDLWNENLKEYSHEINPDGSVYVSSVEMAKDTGRDKFGICFSDLGSVVPEVKTVAVAAKDDGPYYDLSLENVQSRRYPLFLSLYAYAHRTLGKPVEPKVREFFRYVLSHEGQEAIIKDGKWLPLPASVAREQLRNLDDLKGGLDSDAKTMGLQANLVRPAQGLGDGTDELGKVTDAKARYYDRRWDLSDLPPYKPGQPVSGTLRLPPGGYLMMGNVGQAWEAGFKAFHPGIQFSHMTGLLGEKQIDLQTGRRWTQYFTGELYCYQLQYARSPLEIQMATGSYDVPGWSPALAIFVNRGNPLSGLSVGQLDGIFGGPRRGGWVGTAWRRQVARGADGNIRRWEQLGMTGRWVGQPIDVYTPPIKYHIMSVFERKVFQGGNMWGDNVRECATGVNPDGARHDSVTERAAAVGADINGITFSDIGSIESKDVKPVPVAGSAGGPFVPATLENVRNRSYPLSLEVYAYADQEKGKPMDPKVREFLRYILSRDGQNAIQEDGKWLPLTGTVVREQLMKLDLADPASGTRPSNAEGRH